MRRPISWIGTVSVPLLFALATVTGEALRAQSMSAETIEIDAGARTHPFPHFWEKCSVRGAPS